jgi:hypothetical protein
VEVFEPEESEKASHLSLQNRNGGTTQGGGQNGIGNVASSDGADAIAALWRSMVHAFDHGVSE